MRQIELLAPAKNKETAFAAIDHGADAVYIGARNFGARAAACNSSEDIGEVVRYAHQFGVKVYVTINTLLYDEELEPAVELAHEMFGIGVDAIIVQDERLKPAYERKYSFPMREGKGGSFHSSTQMDNRDASIVKKRLEQGYEQTVLARELTIEEIAEVHRLVPEMPLEVFIHGAICVCYNGRCYASEACYGRSANRGECAQFCRMRYTLENEQQVTLPIEGKGWGEGLYLLSMRDMDRTDDLEALLDAGVTSLKIEGRLKDVAYVKNVTAWYRQHLDEIFARRKVLNADGGYEPEFCRLSWGGETFYFTPDINRTFNRGYTNYFTHGRTKDLCNTLTPKSMGEKVGFVKEIRRDHIVVAGTAAFHNGDGLVALPPYPSQRRGEVTTDKPGLIGFRVNRADNNHLYPFKMPVGLRDGMVLYRNQDEAMEKILSGKTAERKIPISWKICEFSVKGSDPLAEKKCEMPTKGENPGVGFILKVATPMAEKEKFFPLEHQLARSPQEQSIRDVLSKLGDTIYEAENIEIDFTNQWFIPRSVLTDWRREVLKLLTEKEEKFKHTEIITPLAHSEATGGRFSSAVQGCKPKGKAEGWGIGAALMTCRYCIRYQTGQCLKVNPHAVKGPLYLRGADGRRYLLKFDCKKCEMQVILENDKHKN